jgi:hypothetical protein
MVQLASGIEALVASGWSVYLLSCGQLLHVRCKTLQCGPRCLKEMDQCVYVCVCGCLFLFLAVGYAFQGQGSVTSDDGWTGYYDTSLHDGTDREVLPMDTVNAANGWDPALSGANALWSNDIAEDGIGGGINVDDPKTWSYNEPLTVQQFTDSDYVPYGYTLGGPSHSSVADEGGGKGR